VVTEWHKNPALTIYVIKYWFEWLYLIKNTNNELEEECLRCRHSGTLHKSISSSSILLVILPDLFSFNSYFIQYISEESFALSPNCLSPLEKKCVSSP
jgi:hypothetical protein